MIATNTYDGRSQQRDIMHRSTAQLKPRNPLSRREEEILHLVASEYTTPMIAAKLFISTHTVISHRKRLMDKLEVSNCAGMVRKGFEIGILKTGIL